MNKKLTTIVIAVAVIALVGAVAWLFVSGKLVWVGSNTKPAVTKVLCSGDMVDKYNRAMYFAVREEGAEPSVDTETLKSIKEEINAKADNESDPTCQTLLFLTAVHERDYEAAKASAEAVKEMHSKNIFADSNIRGNTPVFMYETSVKTISPEFESTEDTGASN